MPFIPCWSLQGPVRTHGLSFTRRLRWTIFGSEIRTVVTPNKGVKFSLFDPFSQKLKNKRNFDESLTLTTILSELEQNKGKVICEKKYCSGFLLTESAERNRKGLFADSCLFSQIIKIKI